MRYKQYISRYSGLFKLTNWLELINKFHPMEQNINDENDVDALMLTQDKNLRCIAILTSKIMMASLGNFL